MKTEEKVTPGSPEESKKDYPIEHFLKLYELQVAIFNGRRTIFWTTILSIWTGIAIGTGSLYGRIVFHYWALTLFYSILFLIFCFIWLFKIWYADKCDHEWWGYYRNIAEYKLGIRKKNEKSLSDIKVPRIKKGDESKRRGYYYKEFFKDSWIQAELLFTLFLIFTSIFLLCRY